MTWNAEQIVNQTLGRAEMRARAGPDIEGDHVAVLMGLFNGAANLQDQLISIARQTHGNWSLIVSDDGSTDCGPQLVRTFAEQTAQRVTPIDGPRRGFAQNFLHLLTAAGPVVPYAALSDQDDVWLPDKLDRALAMLRMVPSGRPALYAGRTVICDAKLRPLRLSPLFELPPGFLNALVQCIGGGNTMVLNRAALDLVQQTARHAVGIVSHDWWIYQIVSGSGGHVIYDAKPMVLYRQHGSNIIGANDSPLAGAKRVALVFSGRFRGWNTANIAALDASSHWLTPESRQILAKFRETRRGTPFSRLQALQRSGVYRQSKRGNLALSLGTLLGKV